MTEEAAVKLTAELLAQCGLNEWRVEVFQFIPVDAGLPAGTVCHGQTNYRRKAIQLSLKGGFSLDTVVHEIAHVCSSVRGHGAEFDEQFNRILPLAEFLIGVTGKP